MKKLGKYISLVIILLAVFIFVSFLTGIPQRIYFYHKYFDIDSDLIDFTPSVLEDVKEISGTEISLSNLTMIIEPNKLVDLKFLENEGHRPKRIELYFTDSFLAISEPTIFSKAQIYTVVL